MAIAQFLHDRINRLLRVDCFRWRRYHADGEAESLRCPVHCEESGEAEPLLDQVFQLGCCYLGFFNRAQPQNSLLLQGPDMGLRPTAIKDARLAQHYLVNSAMPR
jgi:hypothetical protein